MPTDFYSSSYGPLLFTPGWPSNRRDALIPAATSCFASGEFGTVLLQEIQTEGYAFHYYIFSLLRQASLYAKGDGIGLQTLLTMKGRLQFRLKGTATQTISEGQFTLFDARHVESEMIIPGGEECHLINTFYPSRGYNEWLPHFPALKRELDKPVKKSRFYLSHPRPARHTVLDAVREILKAQYQPDLQRIHWELKLKQALFTQLAQTYTEEDVASPTPLELEMAHRAQEIIVEDISRHYPNDQLAQLVGWSESSLKRAFTKVFGVGLYEYLRAARMEKARELLLQGEQVKTVAPTVGMRPSNFTMEFQKFYGYKATSLRKAK